MKKQLTIILYMTTDRINVTEEMIESSQREMIAEGEVDGVCGDGKVSIQSPLLVLTSTTERTK